ALLFALESCKFGWYDSPSGLRLEFDEERDVEEILLHTNKEERSIGLYRAADRSAKMVLPVIERTIECVRRCQLGTSIEIESFTMEAIPARLCNDVDETRVCASHFDRRSAPYYLKLAHCGLRKEEYRVVAAALIALQRIVEVGAVNRDI